MLVISCDMYRLCRDWWSNDYRKRPMMLCGGDLGKMFHVPCSVTEITMALHTTPAKERVGVRVIEGDYGCLVVRTDERGVHSARLAVPDWVRRVVRKYEGKLLYLEVTY